jgi:hypothetical protein
MNDLLNSVESNNDMENFDVYNLSSNEQMAMAQKIARGYHNIAHSKDGMRHGVRGVQATSTIVIKRLTKAINAILPVPVFGANGLQSNYQRELSSFLPAGVTMTGIQIGLKSGSSYSQKAAFTFFDGTNTDIVEVTCNEIPYPSYLASMQGSDEFRFSRNRYRISDGTYQDQLNNSLIVVKQSLFGKAENDNIVPATFQTPNQQQNNIVDIDLPISITKEKTMLVNIGAYVNNFSITLQMFVTKIEKS